MDITKIAENIYSFPIPLPDNPLKWLNCYVVKGMPGERSLLIDTGFNRAECRQALFEGMELLELIPESTDVFLTHAHSDHCGNAHALEQLGCRIMMSRRDFEALREYKWDERGERALREGMPEDVLRSIFANIPAMKYASPPFNAHLTEGGDRHCYGGYSFECVPSPGHTHGHTCLYDREKKLIFLGDHVLFDISPNINSRGEGTDALGTYIESLKMLSTLDMEIALPAHRTTGRISVYERIEELLAHHEKRLSETLAIIRDAPGLNAYEIAGRMKWKIRAESWENFPTGQKWFAASEALAHLDRLLHLGSISRSMDENGIIVYTAV